MSEKASHPGDPYDYPLIIKKILNTPLICAPDQEIVYRDQMRYTYRDLWGRINRLANALANLGAGPGDTAAVFDYDSHRYLEAFFAVPMMGAVLQTVNWRLSADQITYTLNHAEAKIILINADFLPILETIRPRLDTVKNIVLISETGADAAAGFDGAYEALLADAGASYPFPDLDEHTKATTFYTTGTTGDPKGVHFSHRQIVLHTFAVAAALGCYHTAGRFRSNDVYMPITPMFHVHAWGIPYVASLLGVKQVYPGKYEPAMLLKLIIREKVTFSHCVPTILQMLVASPAVKAVDLSNWKVIIGGARLPRGLAKATKDLGVDVYTGYGMSETCPVISLGVPKTQKLDMDADETLDIITKTGLPIPLAEMEVVDAEDRPLPHDGLSTGELRLRSPWLTKSYFKAPDQTARLWKDGWLYTGDVGHIDPEGYLQITDRIKDVIKTGGEWVSSLDLENALSQHAAVLESAAVGVPDEKWGETPLMLVALKPDFAGKVTAEDLKAHMQACADAGKLPKYAVPRKYEFVEDIPKTSVGKLNKKHIREMYR